MKRVAPILLVTLFLAGIFIVPAGVTNTPARLQETALLNNVTLKQDAELSWLPEGRDIRVALYNETGGTLPSYVLGGMNTNYSFIYDLLVNAGYQVDRITFQDILDHKLNTKNYDVLVLADNCPRDNIVDLTREFWLGGGGILSFDSSMCFLSYAGILPRETLYSSNGNPTYWQYHWQGTANVSTRHPVTKSYANGTSLAIDTSLNYVQCSKSAFDTTSIASDITYLAVDKDDSNWFQAVAVDPSDMGGRVVQLGIPVDPWSTPWEDMMVDAVEWLCPRPKGRILFDMSHQPYYGVDPWDAALSAFDTKYQDWRASLVNRSYTFDKLWPSASGNLTAENLQDYDMLIALCPGYNYTSAEVQAVMNWVSAGGGLLAFGEQTSGLLQDHRANINYLLHSTGLRVNDTNNVVGTLDTFAIHPMLESVSQLSYAAAGVVDTSGQAFPLVTSDNGDVFAGAQEYVNGRIVLINDINVFDVDRLYQNDNRQFAVNIANWLTAATADVLLFDNLYGANPYIGASAHALNELGIKYYLTYSTSYFNLSLSLGGWDLVVMDSPWGLTQAFLEDLDGYVNSNTKFIISYFQVDNWPSEPLWARLGFEFVADMPSSMHEQYIWDTSHPIFNVPYDYGVANYTPGVDYGDEGDVLRVFSNGTALAGINQTALEGDATMVLGNNGRTLYNAFLVDELINDLDDSTYEDAFELWINEIAYMMRPQIDSPTDVSIEYGVTGQKVTWTPTSSYPYSLTVKENSAQIASIPWDGGPYSILLDSYLPGVHTFNVEAMDTFGGTATDTVVVTVQDTTAPSLNAAPTNLQYEAGTAVHLLDWNFTDLLPDSYWLLIDNETVESETWDGSLISFDVGGLSEGTYNVTLAVNDTSGNMASSSVVLTVTAVTTSSTTTTTTTPTQTSTSGPPGLGDTTMLILMIIAAIAVVVIIVVIVSRRRK